MIKASVAAAMSVVALAAGPAFAGQHYRVVATDPKSHATIEVPLGDRLVLRLEDCTDCGYSWKILSKPNSAVIVYSKQLNSQRDPGDCKPPCAGGSVHVRFQFQSKGQGETTVKLGYFPPGRSKPAKTKLLNLAVTG